MGRSCDGGRERREEVGERTEGSERESSSLDSPAFTAKGALRTHFAFIGDSEPSCSLWAQREGATGGQGQRSPHTIEQTDRDHIDVGRAPTLPGVVRRLGDREADVFGRVECEEPGFLGEPSRELGLNIHAV